MAELVTLETPQEGVALVTLTDPAIHNNVSWAGIDALSGALVSAREGGARVCVLASGVPGHWLEHAWLRDLRNMVTGQPTTSSGGGWFSALHELNATHMVSIAAISGDASGGGAELGWACDLRVAEAQARIAQPEVMIGLVTGIGGTTRLTRLIGRSAAAEMVLDGAPLGAQRLYELGGVNRIVPEGEALASSLRWATRLASRPPAALATLKQMLVAADDLPLDQALAREQQLFQKIAVTPEAAEGMKRVQERLDAGETFRDVYDGGSDEP
jgi:enoyl-CoA hydratase/carnithine racemase